MDESTITPNPLASTAVTPARGSRALARRAWRATWVVASLAVSAGPVAAEFTFRTVAAPQPGERNRITVQIDPSAPQVVASAFPPRDPDAPPVAAGRGGAATMAPDWFWAGVSPSITDAGPGRLGEALAYIDQSPEAPAGPRLQSLQDIARLHGQTILRETVGTRVSPALALAVISVESAGRTDAVSHAGAAGLMQLMPATAERFGVTDRMSPEQSIRGGVAYLDWLLGEFGGDPILALAGYNAGEGAVHDNGGVPPYAETRAYVPKVLAAFNVARGLCRTPPELASDGCVFVVSSD